MRINTNTLSINAQRNLGEVSRGFQRALERLSSGSRISRAGDDAAGLAISNGIESEVRGLRQATRNINDAFGFFTTSEGAIRTQTEIVQRMRELAVQASNGAIGSKERGLLNTELQELLSEFHRIASQTSFNGTKVLAEARNFQLQVGNRGTNQIEVGMKSTRADEVFTKTEVLPTGKFSQSEQNESLGWSAVTSNTSNGKDLLVSYVSGSGSLRFLQADGAGGLEELQSLNVGTSATISPQFQDLTGNGRDELLFMDNTGLRVFESNEAGVWSEKQSIAGVQDYDVGDINGDGKLDLAVRIGSNVSTYLNDGSASFSFFETFAGAFAGFIGSGQAGTSVALLDLTGNGRADLGYLTQDAMFAFGADQLTTYLSDTDGSMSFGSNTIAGDGLTITGKGDVNGNGRTDLVIDSGWIIGGDTYLSNGDGSFNTPGGPLQSRPPGIFADLNGNGMLDFVQFNGVIRLNQGAGLLSVSQNFTSQLGAAPRRKPLIADLNGNGHLDLAFQSTTGAQLTVLFNDGEGNFKISQTFDLGAGSLPNFGVLGMDLNGDGLKDIIAPGSGESLFLMGSFEREVAETDIRIDTQERAQDMLALFDTGLSNLLDRLALIGATTSRLESARESILITTENLESARSQIRDADIAEETANLVRMQILQQAGVSVLGQANLSPQLALQLLNT